MTTKTEYRLGWTRAPGDQGGGRRKYKRFQSLAAAERHIARLTGPGLDPHYACDHDSGYCAPLPPIIAGPDLQAREVTAWVPVESES